MSRGRAELDVLRAVNNAPMPKIVLRVMLRRIAKEGDSESLAVLAKNLDLPMDDAEAVDYLRQVFLATYDEMIKLAKEIRS